MTDIFFSYSSKDRARAQPVRDALANRGFVVFWDQEVPAGTDWDTWIRRHLTDAKCVIVLWSKHSILSDNVRHEAVIAREQTKLVPVLLDEIRADQFPMGQHAVQAANLSSWDGDLNAAEWAKLLNQVESKLTPEWIRRTLDSMEANLVAERSRRETAERRDRTFREQIAKEAEARQQLQAERDHALEQIAQQQAASINERTAAEEEIKSLAHQLEVSQENLQAALQTSATAVHDYSVVQAELDRAREQITQLQDQVAASEKERARADIATRKSAQLLKAPQAQFSAVERPIEATEQARQSATRLSMRAAEQQDKASERPERPIKPIEPGASMMQTRELGGAISNHAERRRRSERRPSSTRTTALWMFIVVGAFVTFVIVMILFTGR